MYIPIALCYKMHNTLFSFTIKMVSVALKSYYTKSKREYGWNKKDA